MTAASRGSGASPTNLDARSLTVQTIKAEVQGSEPMIDQERKISSLFTFRNVACTAAVVLALVVIPVGVASAQDATGTVVCEQIPDYTVGDPTLHEFQTVTYPVQFYWNNMVLDRWGTGKDVQYQGEMGLLQISKKLTSFTFTIYFYAMSDPNNLDTFEQLYSETGLWTVRVGKDNSMTITGESFAISDTISQTVAAECKWTLEGTYPGS